MIGVAHLLARRLPWDVRLLRSSAVVFVGNATARLLGFLFYVAAARLLVPSEYGIFAYALAILTTASILLTNSPTGLVRFLARNRDDRRKQDVYFTNWVAVVALMLVASLVLLLPFAPLMGLDGWMLLGVVINLVNIAVFETYLQAQRGLGRFGFIGAFYVLSNFLQLVGILIAAGAGWRSAPLFLVIYGLSAIAALILMELISPIPVSLRLATVARRHLIRITRYSLPIIAQGVFYALWEGADLILIQHILGPTATGNYAAAKTLAQVLGLAPTAIFMAASPDLARATEAALRHYLMRLLGFTAAIAVPVGAAMILLRAPLTAVIYGLKYPHILDALPAMVAGVTLYGFYLVLASAWGALGRPLVGAMATAFGTVTTVGLVFALIPRMGLTGAGLGFAAGAAAQLLFVSVFTLWGLYSTATARVGHLPDDAMLSLE